MMTLNGSNPFCLPLASIPPHAPSVTTSPPFRHMRSFQVIPTLAIGRNAKLNLSLYSITPNSRSYKISASIFYSFLNLEKIPSFLFICGLRQIPFFPFLLNLCIYLWLLFLYIYFFLFVRFFLQVTF